MDFFLGSTIFLVGLFAGFINVIVGSGSSVTVPALIFLGFPPIISVATNRFAMLFNNLTGAVEYHKRKVLNVRAALLFSLFAGIGAFIGANLVLKTTPAILSNIIAVVLLLEVVVLLFIRKSMGLEKKIVEFSQKHHILGAVFGFLIGVYGGFLGLGITSMIIFFLILLFGFTFLESSAISKVIAFVISLIAALVFLANFKVDLLVGALLTVAYIIGAYAGVHSAVKMGDPRIKILFAIVVTASAINLLLGGK